MTEQPETIEGRMIYLVDIDFPPWSHAFYKNRKDILMLERQTMTITRMFVTPEQAQIWLRTNNHNRVKSPTLVKFYARAMKEGRWRLNGETIKVSIGGVLVDGQHRLQACVDADCGFDTLVALGVDPDTFDTIDSGKKRTASDVIGIDGCRNSAATAAAIRWVIGYRTKQWHASVIKLSNDEVRLFLAAEPGIEESTSQGLVAKAMIAPSIAGALHYLFSEKDASAADKFFTDVGLGTDLSIGDSVLVLRDRVIRDRMNKSRLPRSEIFSLCIRAWNHRRGGSEKTIVLRGSIVMGDGKRSFPEII